MTTPGKRYRSGHHSRDSDAAFLAKTFSRSVHEDGCLLFQGKTDPVSGYPTVDRNGKCSSRHRAVYEAINGHLPSGTHVHHTCPRAHPDRRCCNPLHLKAVTVSEHQHAHRRLSDAAVREIRSRRAGGERTCDLAKEFGYTPQSMTNVISGYRYGDIV